MNNPLYYNAALIAYFEYAMPINGKPPTFTKMLVAATAFATQVDSAVPFDPSEDDQRAELLQSICDAYISGKIQGPTSAINVVFQIVAPSLNPGGGSGAAPGGANTDIQFNDSGAFGGVAGLTYDKLTGCFTAGQGNIANLGVGNISMGVNCTADGISGAIAMGDTCSSGSGNPGGVAIGELCVVIDIGVAIGTRCTCPFPSAGAVAMGEQSISEGSNTTSIGFTCRAGGGGGPGNGNGAVSIGLTCIALAAGTWASGTNAQVVTAGQWEHSAAAWDYAGNSVLQFLGDTLGGPGPFVVALPDGSDFSDWEFTSCTAIIDVTATNIGVPVGHESTHAATETHALLVLSGNPSAPHLINDTIVQQSSTASPVSGLAALGWVLGITRVGAGLRFTFDPGVDPDTIRCGITMRLAQVVQV